MALISGRFRANAIFLREPDFLRVRPWGLVVLVSPGFEVMPQLCLGDWRPALVALGSALGDSRAALVASGSTLGDLLSLWPWPTILNLNKNTNMIDV